ncbi:MAG: PQQ-like beta-propeller repeat protein, partial [Thermomicrobiales bacterium]|nr:PQQ-like beta-propeller repeat protein [Thermomicrobiales bacterium]
MSTPQDHDDVRLAGTVETMRWLHGAAQSQPDAAFVDALERQLMPPIETTRSHAPKSRPAVDELPQPGVRLELPAAPRRTNVGWMYRFASFALVLALIGGTVFAITRFRNGDDETPSTYTAFGAGNLETPTPTIIGELANGEWRVSTAASEAITADEYGMTVGIDVFGDILIRALSNQDSASLEALSIADGSVLWTNDVAWEFSDSNFPSAIANYAFQADANNIYVLTQSQPAADAPYEAPPLALVAIDIESGADLWTREFDRGVASVGTGPLGLYVATYDGGLWKLDPATGDTIWTFTSDFPAGMSIAPFVGADAVVTVSGEGIVTSIDPETGEAIWRIETGLPGHSFSIAEGATASGMKVVAIRGVDQLAEEIEGQRFDEQKSTLMAVELETGKTLWSQTLNDPSKGEMLIADGMIYATTSLVRYGIENSAG